MSELERHATNLVDVVYGNEHLAYDDPTENWFEATKVYRASMAWDAPGVSRLVRSPALQVIATRAGLRYDDHPSIDLPNVLEPDISLTDAASARWSADRFSGAPITFAELGTLLDFGYGVCQRSDGLRRRVPSGGALYPLDLYVLVRSVEGLQHGVHHYDPYRRCLVRLKDFDDAAVGAAFMQEEQVEGFGATIVLSASFWRSRFKYGHRSSRFVLIEAGHVMQNLVLMAAALGLAGRPYGGFIDDELTALVGFVNGIDTAPLYAYVTGSAPDR